jgi:hypothetical protein
MEVDMTETFAAAVLAMLFATGVQAQAGGGQVYKNDKGTCQTFIIFKAGASEDVARAIAMSLKPVK